MAANTVTDVILSRKLTLDTTLVDSITFRQAWSEVVITNFDTAQILTVRTDGGTPTAGGNDMYYVPASSSVALPMNGLTLKVIGSGNVYSATGRN